MLKIQVIQGGSLGCVEYFTAIYKVIMNHSTNFSMDGKNEDLFFLSNGHISPVFYSVLARTGYFPVKELNTFRKIDSRLQGHPTTHEGLPGVRVGKWFFRTRLKCCNWSSNHQEIE
jgi:transketolase